MSELDKLLQGLVGRDDDDDDEESDDEESTGDDEGGGGQGSFSHARRRERFEARAAERLSVRLLAVPDDDSDEEDRIVRESLQLGPSLASYLPQEGAQQAAAAAAASSAFSAAAAASHFSPAPSRFGSTKMASVRPSQSMMTLRSSTSLVSLSTRPRSLSSGKLDGLLFLEQQAQPQAKAQRGICFMATVTVGVLVLVLAASAVGVAFVGPPSRTSHRRASATELIFRRFVLNSPIGGYFW
jgi:hypothetical protein